MFLKDESSIISPLKHPSNLIKRSRSKENEMKMNLKIHLDAKCATLSQITHINEFVFHSVTVYGV